MSTDRSPLIIVGTSAFSNESFSKLIGKLVEKFEITYLPDAAACIARVREANDRTKVGLGDPISQCEWFLFSDFGDSSDMHQLATLRPEARVMGYPAFVDCMILQHKWTKPRPVFNFSMHGAVVCITGFRDRQTVNRLATMINWMGGSVRRYMNANTTTHLVAYRCAGEKVREAAITARRIATVKTSWVEAAWNRRCEEPHLDATDANFVEAHRAKVFQETCLAFVGFAPGSDELKELCNLVYEHDGLVTEDLNDKRLTHVVVTDAWPGHDCILERLKELMVSEPSTGMRSALQSSRLTDSPALTDEAQYRVCMLGLSYRVPVVRLEWFWLSLQLTCLCRLEPYLYVAGPTRTANNNKTDSNVQAGRISLHLPPLARPSISSLDMAGPIDLDHSSQATSSPMPGGDHMTTTTTATNHFSNLGCGEPIEEVDEPSPTKPVPTCHVSLADEHKSDSMLEEKENLCPREAHSLNSPGKRLASPEFDLPKRKSTTHVSMRLKSPLASSADKVSFITSPRHNNSPRGFISPSNELHRSAGRTSHAHRTGVSLSSCSSHDNLITQLADPMTFPSNRERRLCQIAGHPVPSDSPQSPQPPLLALFESDSRGLSTAELFGTCWSPGSFNSGLLLNATNASDCNTSFPLGPSRGSYGFGSLVGSLREATGKCASTDGTIPDTAADSNISGAVKSPVTQIPDNDTQISTPASGKHKSTSRLSLLHTTARKSRTPASDLTSSGTLNLSSSPHVESLRDTPLRTWLEKRQHRVFEFFVTERNYVDILRYLYRVAYPQVLDEEQPGGPILPRQEADYVFGKLGAVVELHERLQPQLNQLEANWSLTDSRLGDVLHMDLLDEMDKAYGNYMQFYSPPHLHHLGEQFPRFLAFMRQVERRRESGRQSLAALLVRPVQRLPSVALLMEGIAKFTPPSHPDYAAVTQFAKGINDLLANINDRLRRNEERLSMLSLYHEIGGAPPEMLSSSRSLVARLNVFELGTSSSGSTTCEPVTLFLLTDCLEVARPRKRHTGEPMAHAMRAALAAVQGDGVDHVSQPDRDQLSAGDVSGLNLQGNTTCPTSSSVADSSMSVAGSTNHVTVTRTGSGASGTSVMNLGLMEGKQRCYFKHLYLLKLHEIKRVVNFDTASPDRAAFGLVVRSSSEADDRVYAYCLAASFAASAAVAAGRCPEPVESAMAAVNSNRPEPIPGSAGPPGSATGNSTNRHTHVATLQACVNEAKRAFISKVCHHIIQVSCLANSPDELLVDVEPEELLGFDLEQVFNATAQALKSKKFGRQLTRNISVKTSRRLIVSAKRGAGPMSTPSHGMNQWFQVPTTNANTNGGVDPRLCGSSVSLITSPRRSVLGSLLGNRGQNTDSTTTFTDPVQSHELGRYASTPLRDQRMGRTAVPPPTPTADQVAQAMLNLIRPSRSAEPVARNGEELARDASFAHPQPLLFDDYADDDPDADCVSIASGNFGGGAWPAFAKQLAPDDLDPVRRLPRLNSTSSIQSDTLDLTSRNSAIDSVTSLRSLRHAAPGARNSLSRARAFPFGRSSVLATAGRAPEHLECIGQRKSVCQSVLAGLKNFRRSIAGAGSALLHGNPAVSPFVSRTGRGLVNPSSLASPALLNRSASVDAGPTAMLSSVVASPLVSGPTGDHLRLSGLSLNRPLPVPPLAEMTEIERDLDGTGDALTHPQPVPPLSATQSFCTSRQTRLPIAPSASSSGPSASPHVHQVFPRSMTATLGPQNSVLTSSGSLRNLFQSAFRNQSSMSGNSSAYHYHPQQHQQQQRTASNPKHDTFKSGAPGAVDSDQNKSPAIVDNDQQQQQQHICEPELDDLPFGQLGSSMLSLTSWDSVSTLNYPVSNNNKKTKKPVDRVPNRTLFSIGRKSGTGSAVWETASHLGVTTTHEDLRRSFRLPVVTRHFAGVGSDSCARKLQKKHKKYKLGAMSHLFQRPSIAKGSDVASSSITEDKRDNNQDGGGEHDEVPPIFHPPRPSTSRRESLLRGLFSR